MIASSLALMLGASISNAQCTNSIGLGICGDNGNIYNDIGFIWNTVSGNTNTYQPMINSSTAVTNLTFQFGGSASSSGDQTGRITTIIGSSLTIAGNGKSLQMGNGRGTLKFDFDKSSNKTITLNSSSISNTNYALYGNLELRGYDDYSDTLIGIFGGKGISGNVTLNGAGSTNFTFENSAGIDGVLTIKDGKNTIIVKGDSTQTRFKGGITSSTFGRSYTTILFDRLNSENRYILKDKVTLEAGSVVYGFTNDMVNNRIFEVDQSLITFNGGSLGFDGAKQVLIGSAGTDTLTLNGGSISFSINPNIAQSSLSAPILAGNLILNGATVFFGLKNTKIGINPFKNPNATNLDGLSTYYVDGNINITDGGLSTFWNDSYGFMAKLKATNITFSGGLVERSNIWFEKGSFGASNQISKINLKNSSGHLIFEDAMTIEGGIGIRDGEGKTSQILFKDNATINKNGQEYAILAKDGGMNPVLEIYFSGKENTVQGISAQGSTAAGSKTITTIFNNTDSKNIINGEIKAHNVFASNFTAKGTINIIFKGSNNTINGKIIASGGTNNLTFEGSGTIADNIEQTNNGVNNLVIAGSGTVLTLNGKSGGTTHQITSLSSTGALNQLILNNTTGTMNTIIQNTLNAPSLDIKLNGTSSNNINLTLQSGGNIIQSISLEENSMGNKIFLSSGTTTINQQIIPNQNTDVTFELGNNVELKFAEGVDSKLDSENKGSTILTLTSSSNFSSISGAKIDITNLNFNQTGIAQTLNVKNTIANFGTITINNTNGANLTIDASNNAVHTSIDKINGNNLSLKFNGHGATLAIMGENTTIKSVSIANDSQATINLSGSNTKSRVASARKTLTIGSSGTSGAFSGNLNAIIFASRTTADKIVIDGTGSTGSITISAKGDINEIVSITYDPSGSNNVQVAEIKNSSTNGNNGTNNIAVQGGESYIGGVLTVAEIVEGTNADEGKYYIGKIEDRGLAQPYQEIANTALTVNYDLYLANFNSINKRMGELRDNPNNQGVWARMFGGNMSNDFGVGSKTDYITAQAGYDYALTLGNAKNYVGVTVAYGKSWTKSNDVSTGNIINGVGTFSLDKVDSNMVEVGIYNSYVEDSGWYNDSILKFDYIMSEFSLSNDPTMSKTNNFAMILSNEVGYRYKFAENEKGNWYIDPQVEIAFGYFNQSDFNRAIFDASQVGTDVSATQDSILTLRSRAGLSLGKKFVTEKGFASIYVGASYEYDYINGGDSSAGRVGGTVTQLDKVESNGRAIVNVGSNIGLSESARLYIDVEKSFGDKQRTFMQFNFGARYSF